MYYKDIETNRKAHAERMSLLKQQAAERRKVGQKK